MNVFWYPGMTLDQLERQVIQAAYRHWRENKTAAASALGISFNTLQAKLTQYDKEASDERERAVTDRERQLDELNRARGLPVAEAQAGVHPQSAAPAPTEPPVPLSQRAKVQDVLPSKAAMGGSPRGR